MFKLYKNGMKGISKSKYSDLDIEGMSDDEFSKISNKLYITILIRTLGGVILFVLSILALIYGGKYAW